MPRTENDLSICTYYTGRNRWAIEVRCETEEMAERFSEAARQTLSTCEIGDDQARTVRITGVGIADRNRAVYFTSGFEAAMKSL